MVSVNVEAKKTVDVMIEKADELNIAVATLDNVSWWTCRCWNFYSWRFV